MNNTIEKKLKLKLESNPSFVEHAFIGDEEKSCFICGREIAHDFGHEIFNWLDRLEKKENTSFSSSPAFSRSYCERCARSEIKRARRTIQRLLTQYKVTN